MWSARYTRRKWVTNHVAIEPHAAQARWGQMRVLRETPDPNDDLLISKTSISSSSLKSPQLTATSHHPSGISTDQICHGFVSEAVFSLFRFHLAASFLLF
jgi:hypothetical protein